MTWPTNLSHCMWMPKEERMHEGREEVAVQVQLYVIKFIDRSKS